MSAVRLHQPNQVKSFTQQPLNDIPFHDLPLRRPEFLPLRARVFRIQLLS